MYSHTQIECKSFTLENILRGYCNKMKVPYQEVKGKSRKRDYVMIRKIFYFNMIKREFSISAIGMAVGGRDYTTVCDGIESLRNYISTKDEILDNYKPIFEL